MQPTPNIEGLTDSTAAANPFVGLRPFESKEALLFFGRDDQTKELMHQLHQTRFLAVVGGSGSGKSSLIRAGLIPKLKAGFLLNDRGRWRVAEMKPGQAPLQNLAAALLSAFETRAGDEALRRLTDEIEVAGADAVADYLADGLEGADSNVLLLVDQFEEIFRFGSFNDSPDPSEDPAEREDRRAEAVDFVSILLELTRRTELPVYVVLTMRSDFLGDCDVFPGLPESMNRSQYLVPRLTHAQRLEAIQCPVRLRRMELEPELTVRVLGDIGEDPDQLPIMQHAMMRTWEKFLKSGGEAVGVEHYEAAGTIKEALSRDAEAALQSLDEGKRLVAERMFQALVETDAQGRRLRRPAKLSDLVEVTGADRETILDIVRRFRDDNRSFLAVSDDRLGGDSIIDISHESLIRQWGTLSRWAEAEAESRELYLRLAADAVRYQKKLVPLWSDPALQLALDWWKERRPNEAWARRYHKEFKLAEGFLNLSEKKRADDEAEAARLRDEQARREREEYEAAQRFAEEQRKRAEEVAEARRLQLVAANEAAEQQKKAAESARELAARQEELALARQSELEVANKLAEQQRKAARRQRGYMLVFAALFVLMLALSVYAFNAKRAAEASELKVQGAFKVLETSLANELMAKEVAKAEKARADEQKLIAEENAEEASDQKLIAEENAGKAEAARRDAEDAKKRAEGVSAQLEEQIVAVRKEQERTQMAVEAGAKYRGATKAQRESNVSQAEKLYTEAIDGYVKMKDAPAQADTYAELGHLLIGWRGPSAPAVAVEDDGSGSRGKVYAQQSDLPGLAAKIVGVVNRGANVSPDDLDSLRRLNVTAEELKGLKFYGDAVARYRQVGDSGAAAAVFNEVGEHFSKSGASFAPVSLDLKRPEHFLRAQAAVTLFCAAGEESTRDADQERRIVSLIKVGKRLAGMTDAEEEEDGEGTTHTLTTGGREAREASVNRTLKGCGGRFGATPDLYFDTALNWYNLLIGRLSRQPGQAAEVLRLRAALASTAVSLAESYFESGNPERAKEYFRRAEGAYAGSDDHGPRAELFARLGRLLLEREDVSAATGYFDRALAEYPRPRDAAGRRKLADLLVEIAAAYSEDDDEQAAKRLELFTRAEGLYQPAAGDFKNQAEVLESIGDALSPGDVERSYYLKAAEAYARAGRTKQQADLLSRVGSSLRASAGRMKAQSEERRLAYEEALKYIQQAADVYGGMGDAARPERAGALNSAGLALSGLGRHADAVASFKNALTLADPQDLRRQGQIHLNMGRSEEALKHTEEAKEAYVKAVEFFRKANYGSFLKEAQKNLDRLTKPPGTPTPTPTPDADAKAEEGQEPAAEFTLRTRLSSPSGGENAPRGKAKFDVDGLEQEITVRVENAPPGATLVVTLDGKEVGTTRADEDGKAELELNSRKLPSFPRAGPRPTAVVVTDEAGNVVVQGTFSAPSK